MFVGVSRRPFLFSLSSTNFIFVHCSVDVIKTGAKFRARFLEERDVGFLFEVPLQKTKRVVQLIRFELGNATQITQMRRGL